MCFLMTVYFFLKKINTKRIDLSIKTICLSVNYNQVFVLTAQRSYIFYRSIVKNNINLKNFSKILYNGHR